MIQSSIRRSYRNSRWSDSWWLLLWCWNQKETLLTINENTFFCISEQTVISITLSVLLMSHRVQYWSIDYSRSNHVYVWSKYQIQHWECGVSQRICINWVSTVLKRSMLTIKQVKSPRSLYNLSPLWQSDQNHMNFV